MISMAKGDVDDDVVEVLGVVLGVVEALGVVIVVLLVEVGLVKRLEVVEAL